MTYGDMMSQMRTLGSFWDKDDKKKNRGSVKNQSVEGKHIRIFRTREGTALRVGEPVIFAPNDATLSLEAIEQLTKAAAEIVGKPNKMEIRAHATDASFDERLPSCISVRETCYASWNSKASFMRDSGSVPPRILNQCQTRETSVPGN